MCNENLLDFLGYHKKWHGNSQQNRKPYDYNQNDFLIEEIFRRIGLEKGTFVEFGAIDGIKGSNTRLLFEKGWAGVFIEPDRDAFYELQTNYKHSKNIHTLNLFVGTQENRFDDIMKDLGIDHIDFCSIDIDGLDLEIFETIEKFLPDIVCIEGGQTLHPSADLISTDVAQNNIHQSLQTYVDVFSRKGYTLVAAHQDNIFVKNKFASLFNVSGKSILDFYLDGILAYPRIPWIYVQMLRYGISNSIIEKIVAGMNIEKLVDVAINGDITAKASWVDTQNQKISSVCNDLRNKDL